MQNELTASMSSFENELQATTSRSPVDNVLTHPGRIRPIVIRQLDHGYTVEVGCQTLAIESTSQLITLLSTYILQPGSTEKLYQEGKLFNK